MQKKALSEGPCYSRLSLLMFSYRFRLITSWSIWSDVVIVREFA